VNLTRRQILGFAGASATFAIGGGAIAGAEVAHHTIRDRQLSRTSGSAHSKNQVHKWLWRLPVSPVIGINAVGLTVVNDSVYLLYATKLQALSADTGHIIWTYSFSTGSANGLSANNGVIYFQSSDPGIGNGTNFSAHLIALSARTGRELWRRTATGAFIVGPLCDGQVAYLATSPAVSGTNVMYAMDAQSGKLIWQLSGLGDTTTYSNENYPPTIVTSAELPVFTRENILYTASQYKLHARNKYTGNEIWAFPYPGYGTNGGPILSDNRIYMSSDVDPSNSKVQMTAIDAETGQQLWGSDIFGGSISIDVIGDTVFALAAETGIWALKAADGSIAWAKTSPSISGNLTVASDLVLVSEPPNNLDGGIVTPGNASGETQISALRSANGRTRWTVTVGGQLNSAPALAGKWACIGISQESISVLNVNTGTTKWTLPTSIEYGPVTNGKILFAIVADEVYETGNASLSGAVCAVEI
jgi:eukaryotic-like serine/threonine-protein kinase